jgi:DNA polymerase
MNIITLDFETYWAQNYTLKKLTTEEYIRSELFEIIGVGIKLNDEETKWYTGTESQLKRDLAIYDWANSILVCHNTMFDGAILSWVLGIDAGLYADTLSMARALLGTEVGGSLATLAIHFGLGKKGTEVLDAKDKRLEDFSCKDLTQYGEYCINDVNLTYDLFKTLMKTFPHTELSLIDMTLRMFIHPLLKLDTAILTDRLYEVQDEKQLMLSALQHKLKCESEEDVRKILASSSKFSKVLEELNVTIPMKLNAKGKEIPALAKNDLGFLELLEHENPFVQQLCTVRLGTKSTIEESRLERIIGVGLRNDNYLPIPLKYYGAHTGRWSGLDSINMQNLPSRDKKKKALKNSIVAPDGYVVINCDSSQIEARVLAWLAGQEDVVNQFANAEDVYSIFASKIYNRPISKADPVERFVGKTCILGLGYGTGAAKLQHTLKTQPPGADLTEDECKDIVKLYRTANNKITDLWKSGDAVIKDLAGGWTENYDFVTNTTSGKKDYYYGEHECLKVTKNGIKLPNNMLIRYPNLHLNTDEAKSYYAYKSRAGMKSLWGGALVENVVQALARIIVGEQMIIINERYRVCLTVHDAAVCVVKESELDEALEFITGVMSVPPSWAKGLPIACEAGYGKSYGDC